MVANKRKRKVVSKTRHDMPKPTKAARFSRAGRALRRPEQDPNNSFVDSTIALDDLSSDQETEYSSQEEGVVVVKPRRRLSKTPELKDPFFEPAAIDQPDSDSMPSDFETTPAFEKFRERYKVDTTQQRPLQIVLKVPAGPAREVTLNVPVSSFTRGGQNEHVSTSSSVKKRLQYHDHRPKKPMVKQPKPSKNVIKNAGLIGRLPVELRNQIYQDIFICTKPIDLGFPDDKLHRSAAFLRSCRLVYEEARPVLYGSNQFSISRRFDAKTSLWGRERVQLGYTPARLFMKSIGAYNISLIRAITLKLSDAEAAYNRGVTTDDRRAINDEYLLSVLRDFIRYGQLRFLKIEIHCRRQIDLYDLRFVNTITRIKVDKLEIDDHTYNYNSRPWHAAVATQHKSELAKHCTKKMVRSTPLYPSA